LRTRDEDASDPQTNHAEQDDENDLQYQLLFQKPTPLSWELNAASCPVSTH
jgi:hypothetical protein